MDGSHPSLSSIAKALAERLGAGLGRVRARVAKKAIQEPEVVQKPAPEETLASQASKQQQDEFEEFADLQTSLGAYDAGSDAERTLALKDAEVSELQANLKQLQSIGDRVAGIEKQRLAEKAEYERESAELRRELEGARSKAATKTEKDAGSAKSDEQLRLEHKLKALQTQNKSLKQSFEKVSAELKREHATMAELRQSLEARPERPHAELEALELELSKAQRAQKRAEQRLGKLEQRCGRDKDRLASLRKRLEEAKSKASERWKEILRLRGQVRDSARKQRKAQS